MHDDERASNLWERSCFTGSIAARFSILASKTLDAFLLQKGPRWLQLGRFARARAKKA